MRRGFSDSYQVTRACACARELMRMQARARACEQVSMRMHRAYACARTRARMLRALLSSAYVVISRWSSVLSPEKISTVPRQQQKQGWALYDRSVILRTSSVSSDMPQQPEHGMHA
mmetsp:Transcript_25718/g.56378  ORF Transcript_25718/g.56378 Transcript_25718/m.56378 type:complete len:116 (-) Transcript_25718:3826-4173(-)